MGRFSELQQAFGQSRKVAFDYRNQCGQFIINFADGLRIYLEAPEKYRKNFSSQEKPAYQRYITVMQVSRDQSGDLTYNELPEGYLISDLIPNEMGKWLTGVKIVLDSSPTTFPKHSFIFPINFSIKDDRCLMFIGDEREGREFNFSLLEPTGAHAAYEYMFEWLQKMLARKPWDLPLKNPIGFIRSETE